MPKRVLRPEELLSPDGKELLYVIRTKLSSGETIDRIFDTHYSALKCGDMLDEKKVFYELLPVEKRFYSKPDNDKKPKEGFIL